MSDMTSEELAAMEATATPNCECTTCRMTVEIRRHRAATAADKERVRRIVFDEALKAMPSDPIVASDIADRCAERLAVSAVRHRTPAVQLTQQERQDIEWHIDRTRRARDTGSMVTSNALNAIERLIGAKP
jgi:hypothetical protein